MVKTKSNKYSNPDTPKWAGCTIIDVREVFTSAASD